MSLTNIMGLLGGLALFLYGMQMMSNGLELAARNQMRDIMKKITSNRIIGVLTGALITAVIQSSSATTVTPSMTRPFAFLSRIHTPVTK